MRLPPHRLLLGLIALLAVALVGCGSTVTASVTDAWVRPAAAGGQSAAYLTISNRSADPDALLSVSSPDATTVDLHETSTDSSGMTGMRLVVRCDVPAGATLRFQPGGYHLMITGLERALASGDTMELDLVFEHAGKVVVQAPVKGA